MPEEFLYLFHAVIVALVLAHFVIEAFNRFRIVRRNLVFLAMNTLALVLLMIPFRKMFFDGVGEWGVNSPWQNPSFMDRILSMGPVFLFFSILLLKLIWLSVGLRTVWLVWKQKGKWK